LVRWDKTRNVTFDSFVWSKSL